MIMKKLAAGCLSLALVIGNAPVCAGASENDDEVYVVKTIAYLEFTGPAIELSIEQALSDALKSGSAIEAAEIKKKSDAADARSSAESFDSMEAANMAASESDGFGGASYGRAAREKARKAEEYYKGIADRNYEAAVNQIIYSITNSYYSMLHAEENLGVAEESLRLQENILEITKQKYDAGISANQDVLQAEINLNGAKAELASAELSLAEKKMQFNDDLGYAQMQDVKLTSSLERPEISALPLDEAVSGALENRNEMYTCAYNVSRAESELASWTGYVAFSSVYKARNSLASAEKSYRDTENSIQREVKMNYANMVNNEIQITNSGLSAEKAKQTLEINMAKYQLGMATLTEVQQSQIDSYKADKSVLDAILKFNLSVLEYEQSATVGRSIN